MTNQERLAELNAIGYPKLTGPQRAEKKSLETLISEEKGDEEFLASDDGSKSSSVPPAPSVANQAPQLVTLTQEQLQEMVDRAVAAATSGQQKKLDDLEKQLGPGNWRKATPGKQKIYTATIRKFRKDADSPWELVVDWKVMKNNVWDENTRRFNKTIYKVTFQNLETGEQRVEDNFALEDFIKVNNYEKVKIIELKKEPLQRVHGYTHTKRKTKEGYVTDEPLDVEVELLETMDFITAVVEFDNGKRMEIPADRLNG